MTPLDYGVVVLYILGMLGVGRYYARQVRTADDYLLGGRTMSPLMIGLSLFATLTSTLSYLAVPGEVVKHGPMIFSEFLAFPLIYYVVGWLLIPAIMRQRVTSGYELLETRLGLTGRLLGAGMFVALRVVWMASILYATSDKVLVPLLGLGSWWMPILSAGLGIVTLLYTVEGGLKAVVVTDAVQSVLMFAGGLIAVAVVTQRMGGFHWWPTEWPAHWQEPVVWPDPAVRVTVVGACLNWIVWMVCTAGSDQMAIQRYLSTRDAAAARRSFGVQLITSGLSQVVLAVTGIALLGYFTTFPQEAPDGRIDIAADADKFLPHFVLIGLPTGLTGLVIAAVLSAAMSSLSSGMNSSSAVIATDFVGRFRSQPLSPAGEVRFARYLSVAVGLIAVLLSLSVGGLSDNLMALCIKVVNLLTAPLFVLFFLALFVPWSTPFGAAASTVASVAVALDVAFFKIATDLTLLWIAPAALVTGVTVGMAASAVPLGLRRGRE